MATKSFTRKFTPTVIAYEWLVLVGDECTEYYVITRTPDEATVRQLLRIPAETPIVIGRP